MVHNTNKTYDHISQDKLRDFIESIYLQLGATNDTSSIVADSLVEADLRGHNSHGVQLSMFYADKIREGSIDPSAVPNIDEKANKGTIIDGKFGFGRVTGRYATDVIIDQAKETGISIVGIKDGNHIGRMGEFAEIAANKGYLFIAFTKAEGKFVAPPGSTERRISTNPLTMGVPTYGELDYPIVLDIATSTVANAKTIEKQMANEPMPEGWAVSNFGEPLTDAEAFQDGEGALLPLGGQIAGYKGFGLATMVELFGSIIGDGPVAGQREHVETVNTASFIAIDPENFTTRESIKTRIRDYEDYIKSAKPSPEVSPGVAAKGEKALLPGEAEHLTAEERRNKGIPLSDGVVQNLNELAADVGIDKSL